MQQTRVLVADDNRTFGATLSRFVGSQPDMDVVGLATSGSEALAMAATLQPDVVLMDLYMPDTNGFEATKRLADADPRVKVIALTAHGSKDMEQRSLEAGASAFVRKSEVDMRLMEHIRRARLEPVKAFPERRALRAKMLAAIVTSDILALFAATQLASLIRFGGIWTAPAIPSVGASFLWVPLLMSAILLASLWIERLYDLSRVFWGSGEYRRVVKALSMGIVGFILAEYVLKVTGLSREWTLMAWAFSIGFVVAGRAVVRWGIGHERTRGRLLRPALIVGCNCECTEIVRAVRRDPSSGLVPIGYLSLTRSTHELATAEGGSLPYLGPPQEIRSVLDERFVDTVIIASSEFERDAVSRMINDLRGYDVDVQLSAGLLDVTTSRINVSEVSGLPLIGVKGVSFAPWKRATKRAFDLAIGGIIMIVGLPVWLLLALAIKIDSRGPILYKQARVGRDGQPFGMFKFRSMCDDAEARLAELWRDNEADGPLFKMRDDPRVTRVGRWMRRHSIDEFPQLLNVLRGEMSLVGPRPPLLHETHNYNDDQWHRMEVLPGMTGLWQVSGRSRLTFDEMVHLDLFYIENWSVGFDLGLMARTVSEVLFADGAY